MFSRPRFESPIYRRGLITLKRRGRHLLRHDVPRNRSTRRLSNGHVREWNGISQRDIKAKELKEKKRAKSAPIRNEAERQLQHLQIQYGTHEPSDESDSDYVDEESSAMHESSDEWDPDNKELSFMHASSDESSEV